jgi:hypothetical protein
MVVNHFRPFLSLSRLEPAPRVTPRSGLLCGRLKPCQQILDWLEVAGNDKHSRLLRYRINYSRKKIIVAVPGGVALTIMSSTPTLSKYRHFAMP